MSAFEDRAQTQYDVFNEMYFGGRMPEVEIRGVNDLRLSRGKRQRLNGATSKVDGAFLIELDANMPDALQKLTLIHEMIHIKVWPKSHRSKAWRDEVARLGRDGFLAEVF